VKNKVINNLDREEQSIELNFLFQIEVDQLFDKNHPLFINLFKFRVGAIINQFLMIQIEFFRLKLTDKLRPIIFAGNVRNLTFQL